MVKAARSADKSEDFSESVNSFHSGAISLPSSSHETSRNTFVASILFSGRRGSSAAVEVARQQVEVA